LDIKLENITKTFGSKRILNNFCANFKDKKINMLKGPSGFGKTTILNIIMGLCQPDSGNIFGVKGRYISCVFQNKRLLVKESAKVNVTCVINSLQKQQEKALYWLQKLGLSQKDCNENVENLSGGMQQLVSIARALAAPKQILLLDEPFVGLDKNLKNRVFEIIKQETKDILTILVTHDESFAT
jgi:NitT/TauT family transport system ATP-binding protein